jgi:hypothetical protein
VNSIDLAHVKASVVTNYAIRIEFYLFLNHIQRVGATLNVVTTQKESLTFFRDGVYLIWAKWQKFTDQAVCPVQLILFRPLR